MRLFPDAGQGLFFAKRARANDEVLRRLRRGGGALAKSFYKGHSGGFSVGTRGNSQSPYVSFSHFMWETVHKCIPLRQYLPDLPLK